MRKLPIDTKSVSQVSVRDISNRLVAASDQKQDGTQASKVHRSIVEGDHSIVSKGSPTQKELQTLRDPACSRVVPLNPEELIHRCNFAFLERRSSNEM